MTLLSAAGYPAVSIAQLVGYDPRTVRRWIERGVDEGVDGLPDRSGTGRPGSTAMVARRLSTPPPKSTGGGTVPFAEPAGTPPT